MGPMSANLAVSEVTRPVPESEMHCITDLALGAPEVARNDRTIAPVSFREPLTLLPFRQRQQSPIGTRLRELQNSLRVR